jgi:hypothetical protein
LPQAFYCFFRSPEDFRETLLQAVNCSRDADTVAAIACNLSGTLNGVRSIPQHYLDDLEFRQNLDFMAYSFAAVKPRRFVEDIRDGAVERWSRTTSNIARHLGEQSTIGFQLYNSQYQRCFPGFTNPPGTPHSDKRMHQREARESGDGVLSPSTITAIY